MTPLGVCFSRAAPFVKRRESHVQPPSPGPSSFVAGLRPQRTPVLGVYARSVNRSIPPFQSNRILNRYVLPWYRVLELSYTGYSDKKRDELYQEIISGLGQ